METLLSDAVERSAKFRLPNELWLTIFEQLLTHDVHIFRQSWRYRRDEMRDLRTLQLVCSSWRHLVEPLTYRHLTFDGHPQKAMDRFVRFAKLLSPNEEFCSAKTSRIHTLWLRIGGNGQWKFIEQPRAFAAGFTNLLPQLTSIREISLRMNLSVQDFAIITRCHAPAIKKLAVCFQYHDLREVFPLLQHFTALQELNLITYDYHYQRSQIPIPDQGIHLPSLRSLELDVDSTADHILNPSNLSSIPNLTELRVRAKYIPRGCGLSTFLSRHGANLTTFRYEVCRSNGFNVSNLHGTAILPHTPQLRILEFESTRWLSRQLRNLPISVTEVVFSKVIFRAGHYANTMEEIVVAVEKLSHGNGLRTVRFTRPQLSNCGPCLWKTEALQFSKPRSYAWKRFTDGAARLLAPGVVVVDERDVVLTDVLKEMDTQSSVGPDHLQDSSSNVFRHSMFQSKP